MNTTNQLKTLRRKPIDKKFLIVTLLLLAVGVLTYISTSLPIYTENSKMFWSLMLRHIGLGVIGGLIAMFIVSTIDHQLWKRFALPIFIITVIGTFLVFIPGLGFSHGGAQRWINLGFVTLQPSEFLKLGVIIFISAWYSKYTDKVKTFKYGLLPFLVVVGIAFAALVKQPDTGYMALIGTVAFSIYWLRGASFKHILITGALVAVFATIYVVFNPHVIDRLKTYRDINRDPLGSSYQIRQSKIAIGSGKLYGRGLGQSVHKFGSYLPESNSDSIFAIFAEELGFIGSTLLVSLYLIFTFLGARIARLAPTPFGQNVVIGIILLISLQVFINIAGASGLLPLDGIPLIFMSHGGTALFITLASLGIVMNVSRYERSSTATKNI